MNKLNIAKTLISKRRETGITQDQLASHIGVTKASVSKWETGQSYPDISFLPELASYFDISIDELINYEPQLIKNDIKKLYHKLCKDFTIKPFDEVEQEIKDITKKYYSCFPLLLEMGLILINHHDIVKDEKRESVINEALTILIRIQGLCNEIEICRRAKSLEAMCYVLLNKPTLIIDLMQDSMSPMLNEISILSQGYMMNAQQDKAVEALQVGIYQNVCAIINSLVSLLYCSSDKTNVIEIENRIFKITDAFNIESLQPAIMFNIYLMQAQRYVLEKDDDNALIVLQKYVDLATSDIFPLKLHGDDFFNKIDMWISDTDIGAEAPRASKTIKNGLVVAIKENPVFSSLSENSKYKFMIEKLSSLEK